MKMRASSILRPRRVWRHRAAIKESIDNLPYGICFSYTNGIVILCNKTMESLARLLQGYTLQDGYLFWSKAEEKGTWINDQALLLDLEPNGIWLLSRERKQLEGKDIYAIEAQDVSQACRLNEQLEQENQKLAQLAERLKQYSMDVKELTRQRVLLERRTHTHDEMGRLLVETRQYLSTGKGDISQLLPRWKINATLIKEERRELETKDVLAQLEQVAAAIGVKLDCQGVFPQAGESSELVMAAGAESLTNLVRHGHGNALKISSCFRNNAWHIVFGSNGSLPDGPVCEGGGLGTLRKKVEDAGGCMEVKVNDCFWLILQLPERKTLECTEL